MELIEILNQNQWVIWMIWIIVAILLSFIWISKAMSIKQVQKSWNNSNNIQIWNINNWKKND